VKLIRSISLAALFLIYVPHSFGQAASSFEPFDRWSAAVVSSNQASLAAFYSTNPPAQNQTPAGKTVDANEEPMFWSALGARGLSDFDPKVLSITRPQPGEVGRRARALRRRRCALRCASRRRSPAGILCQAPSRASLWRPRGERRSFCPASRTAGRSGIHRGGLSHHQDGRHSFQEVTAIASSYAECRRVARVAASNFYYAFYMLPKIAGRPLQKQYFALFAFWTFILFASWCGMPQTAPIPAWLPAASTVASALLILPLIGFWATFVNTVCGAKVNCKGGPFCYVKFGTTAFLLSILLMIITGCCPHIGRVLGLTWFGPAVVQLLIFGFFAIVICGAIYELLPSVMDLELPFPGFVRFQHWFFMAGSIVLFLSLAIAGVEQGIKMQNPNIAFTDVMQATLTPLRFAALGLACLLVGSLMLAANFLVMTIKWHCALVKCVATAIQAPLETDEVKS